MHIEVIGNRVEHEEPGTLARAIVGHFDEVDDISAAALSAPQRAELVVFCEREPAGLDGVVEYCNDTENPVPLLFLSSKIRIPDIDQQNFPLITARNSNLDVVRFMANIVEQGLTTYNGWDAHIDEYHQTSKKDQSGTGLWICDMLRSTRDVMSMRNHRDLERTKEQYPDNAAVSLLEPGDPYAIHAVEFRDPVTREAVKPVEDIIVTDHSGYGKGVEAVARALSNQRSRFENKTYDIVDLAQQGIVE